MRSVGTDTGSRTHLVVLFRPDVERATAESLLLNLNLRLLSRPDLLHNQYLIEANLDKAFELAERDEVAYLYPASEDLVAGVPVHGCLGPLADDGQIAQYVSSYGQGWDGPGRGEASLTYTISQAGSQVRREVLTGFITRALGEWTRHARIRISETSTPGARNINFVLAQRAHGDGYSFDGRGRILAHTFYPADVAFEPLAGDVHLDDDEPWNSRIDPDLYSVILHEIGHALGLGHSDRPGAVMYPYYRRLSTLQTDDVAALQRLYAAPEAISGSESAIAIIAPEQPAPTPQQPAPAAANERTPPALIVRFPATTLYATSSATVRLAGTARDASGVQEVTWFSSSGATGTARGTSSWAVDAVPLLIGDNTITVFARDAAGNTPRRVVTVTRR